MSAATRIAPTTTGGTRGSLAAIPIGGKVAGADYPDLLKLLGTEIDGPNGSRFRLVQLNYATGFANTGVTNYASRKVFVLSAETGAYDVEPGDAATERPYGVSVTSQEALVDDDVFWVQIEGVVELTVSDDVGTVAAGDFVGCDDDADKGKVKTTTTSFTHGVTPFRAIDAVTTTPDTAFRAQILHRLNG